MTGLPPVRREVFVDAPPAQAFAVFTQQIGSWWPLARLSVFRDGTVGFEGRQLVERAGDRSSVWAEVVSWNPAAELRLSWHPGAAAALATDVRVTFTAQDEGTLVVVEHRGWEALADPAAKAEEYGNGWPGVLSSFAAAVGTRLPAPGEVPAEERWFALLHRPGPALPEGASIFETPEFALHRAFLGRLAELGLLVAAGPLGDEDGAGMTVVRVGPEHGDVDVVALATTDDGCVAAGFLEVTVRPWRVVLSAV